MIACVRFGQPTGDRSKRESDHNLSQEAIAAAAILDDVFYGTGVAQFESFIREITLQVLDHMMDVVQVKKWALPEDQQKRPPMPWEPGALDLADPEPDADTEGASDPEN